MATYDKVMIKISGEQLGSEDNNFDVDNARSVCRVIEAVVANRHKVACVVGGGNVVRGAKLTEGGFTGAVVADQMGMLATLQNGLFIAHILEEFEGIQPFLLSKVPMDSLAETYSYRRATTLLQKVGNVVIVAGGTGNAGYTTDMGTVTVAYELGCPIAIKTTSVDGVYDDDPNTNADAERIQRMTLDRALQDPLVKIMDNSALAFARDHGITIGICRPDPESVMSVINGDTTLGSLITPS